MSLPMRGEWIEMQISCETGDGRISLSPCGESGLKYEDVDSEGEVRRSLPMRGEWIEIPPWKRNWPGSPVSPHAGRVD